MQKVFLTGRLGKDAIVKESSRGKKFLSFVLATNQKYSGLEETTWWDVAAFNFSDGILNFLKKGTAVQVIGDVRLATSIDKNGVTRFNKNVTVDSIAFAENLTKQSEGTETTNQQCVEQHQKPVVEVSDTVRNISQDSMSDYNGDSDLPF